MLVRADHSLLISSINSEQIELALSPKGTLCTKARGLDRHSMAQVTLMVQGHRLKCRRGPPPAPGQGECNPHLLDWQANIFDCV